MIITRTPLRISLGGGGTDLPSYCRRFGGHVISAAITKYIYVMVNPTFTDDYFVKYAALERVADPADIAHPIIREALAAYPTGPGVEIVSVADIPAGTGLGSSGAFAVGLLRALHTWRREHVTPAALAEEAAGIELGRLGRPGGKQDQYIAAYGGLTQLDFARDGRVTAKPLPVSSDTLHALEERLLLFFTGYARDADCVLDDQRLRTDADDQSMIDNLHQIAQVGRDIGRALEAGDTEAFGALMHEHWTAKRERSPGMSNPDIDRWYEVGWKAGALGGKLVGAGGGGFLLFYTHDPDRLRAAMAAEGRPEVRFGFDHDGSTVLVRH